MKIDEAESSQDHNEAEKYKDSIKNTSIYSCYFEFQLDQSDFGLSRREHNEICNRALATQLELLRKENIQLVDGISNNDLLIHMVRYPNEPPHETLTWEHCPSTTVVDSRLGVMRLVSSSQHNSKSEYWRAFHPDYKNRGGYHEWALPAGAPDDKYSKVNKKFNYQTITVEELPHYFEITVISNCYQDFCKVFSRAQQLLTPTQITRMLSGCYPMGKSKSLNTLLHKAVKNGHQPLINSLLKCGEPVHHLLQIRNHRGNTVAHNAAEHSRHLVLKQLQTLNVDLTVKNKREETVQDIVTSRNFVACLPFSKSSNQQEEQHSSDDEQGGGADTIKDPHFAYGNIGRSDGSKSNRSLKPDSVHSKKDINSLEKSSYQNTNTVKKTLPITQQEIKAIRTAQRALQERKKQKTIAQNSQRHQKLQCKRVLQERIRLFENRNTATQKPQQAQPRKQQHSEIVVRQKTSATERQNVQQQRFFPQQESRRPANPSSTQSIPYQAKPQMNFFQQQRPQSQQIQSSQKPNTQSIQSQKRLQPNIIYNRTAQQNQQRTQKSQQQMQKAQQQRVLLSSQFRPKQPNQQRPAQSGQQLTTQRTQQQSQQRNQQQTQQRTQQQQAQQRAQQQAAQQRAQQQAQQRAQQQAAQQRAQQQAQQRAQQQAAQQRAQQQAQQRAQQQAAQQRAQQQAAQQQAQQRAQQQAAQQRAQQQAQQRAQQQAAQQRAQQQASQRSTYQRK